MAVSHSCIEYLNELVEGIGEPWGTLMVSDIVDGNKLRTILEAATPPQVNIFHNHCKNVANNLLDAHGDAKKAFPKMEWTNTGTAKLKRVQLCDFFQKANEFIDPTMLRAQQRIPAPVAAAPAPPPPVYAAPPPAAVVNAGPPRVQQNTIPTSGSVQNSPPPPARPVESHAYAAAAAAAAAPPPMSLSGGGGGGIANSPAPPPRRGGVANSPVVAVPPPRPVLKDAPPPAAAAPAHIQLPLPSVSPHNDNPTDYCQLLLSRAPAPWNSMSVASVASGEFENVLGGATVPDVNIFHAFLAQDVNPLLDVHPHTRDSRVVSRPDWGSTKNAKLKRVQISDFFKGLAGVVDPRRADVGKENFNRSNNNNNNSFNNTTPVKMPQQQPPQFGTPDRRPATAPPSASSSSGVAAAMGTPTRRPPVEGAVRSYLDDLLRFAPEPWNMADVDVIANAARLGQLLDRSTVPEINVLHSYMRDRAWSVLGEHRGAKETGAFTNPEWTSRGNMKMKRTQIEDFFRNCGPIAAREAAGGGGGGAALGARPQTSAGTPQQQQQQQQLERPSTAPARSMQPPPSAANGEGPVFEYVTDLLSGAPPPWPMVSRSIFADPKVLEAALEDVGPNEISAFHIYLQESAMDVLARHPQTAALKLFRKPNWPKSNIKMKRFQIIEFFKDACHALIIHPASASPVRGPPPPQVLQIHDDEPASGPGSANLRRGLKSPPKYVGGGGGGGGRASWGGELGNDSSSRMEGAAAEIAEDLVLLQNVANRLRANLARHQQEQADEGARQLQEQLDGVKQQLSQYRRSDRRLRMMLDFMQRRTAALTGQVRPIGTLRASIDGGGFSHPKTVNGPVCMVGRGRASDVCLTDPRISNRHFRLVSQADGVYCENLGSNGVWLQQAGGNEAPVPLAKGQPVGPLIDGDAIYCVRGGAHTPIGLPHTIALVFSPYHPEEGEDSQAPVETLVSGLQRHLRCDSCRNTLSVPVTAGCGHSFCSACAVGEDGNLLFSMCPACSAPTSRLVQVAALRGAADALVVHEAATAAMNEFDPPSDGEDTDVE